MAENPTSSSTMQTTFGAPSGALAGSNGSQSGVESRMSTLIVPLNGLLIPYSFDRPVARRLAAEQPGLGSGELVVAQRALPMQGRELVQLLGYRRSRRGSGRGGAGRDGHRLRDDRLLLQVGQARVLIVLRLIPGRRLPGNVPARDVRAAANRRRAQERASSHEHASLHSSQLPGGQFRRSHLTPRVAPGHASWLTPSGWPA